MIFTQIKLSQFSSIKTEAQINSYIDAIINDDMNYKDVYCKVLRTGARKRVESLKRKLDIPAKDRFDALEKIIQSGIAPKLIDVSCIESVEQANKLLNIMVNCKSQFHIVDGKVKFKPNSKRLYSRIKRRISKDRLSLKHIPYKKPRESKIASNIPQNWKKFPCHLMTSSAQCVESMIAIINHESNYNFRNGNDHIGKYAKLHIMKLKERADELSVMSPSISTGQSRIDYRNSVYRNNSIF